MLKSVSPYQAVWLVFAITLAVILGAWGFEYAGYEPCELCLKERWAYYLAIPLSLVIALAAGNNPAPLRNGLRALGLVMVASALFGIYHSGVEWKLWQGPTACTAGAGFKSVLPDLSKQPVLCDQAALKILGLSLASWNAIVSAAAAWLSFAKARQA